MLWSGVVEAGVFATVDGVTALTKPQAAIGLVDDIRWGRVIVRETGNRQPAKQ